MSAFIRKWNLPFLMLGPFLILVFLFFFLPVILILIMAFTSMDSAMHWNFTGVSNFRHLLLDPNLGGILKNTGIYVCCTLLINVIFGLMLGILTVYFVQKESVGLFFRTVWMLPRISPPVVYILLWLWFFDPSQYGVLNSFRSIWHLPPQIWLSNNPMTAIIMANGVVGASYGMIIFSSAIKSIPQALFHAARMDGAYHGAIIKDILIPSIRWPMMFVTLWQMLSLLTSYEYILLLTNGGPLHSSEVLALYSYHKAFGSFQYGYGSALALILVGIALILTLVLWRIFRVNSMIGSTRIE